MPSEGEKAPDFCATDDQNKNICLQDFAGKKVVLYFYPKDHTPGCTKQACNLRDNFEELTKHGIVVIGVSPDSANSHVSFREKYNLPFILIPDPDKKIIDMYGVWGKKKFMGKEYEGVLRTTFLINEDGTIHKVIKDVDVDNHAVQIFEAWGIKKLKR